MEIITGCIEGFSPGRRQISPSNPKNANCIKVLDTQGDQSSSAASCQGQDIWYQKSLVNRGVADLPLFYDDYDVVDLMELLGSGRSFLLLA